MFGSRRELQVEQPLNPLMKPDTRRMCLGEPLYVNAVRTTILHRPASPIPAVLFCQDAKNGKLMEPLPFRRSIGIEGRLVTNMTPE